MPIGERHLRRALHEFVEQYHRERNHQGLGNALIDGSSSPRSRGEIPVVSVLVGGSTTIAARRDGSRLRLGPVLGHYGIVSLAIGMRDRRNSQEPSGYSSESETPSDMSHGNCGTRPVRLRRRCRFSRAQRTTECGIRWINSDPQRLVGSREDAATARGNTGSPARARLQVAQGAARGNTGDARRRLRGAGVDLLGQWPLAANACV
jgi:hypothetical protein